MMTLHILQNWWSVILSWHKYHGSFFGGEAYELAVQDNHRGTGYRHILLEQHGPRSQRISNPNALHGHQEGSLTS